MPRTKPRFSPTRLEAYLTCRMMYRYEYVDRIGKFFHRATASASFGASIHQALQAFHQAGGATVEDAEALTARVRAAWRSAGYADLAEEDEYRNRADEILRRYHAAEADRRERTRLFLAEKELAYDMGAFILVGRIDRIDEHLDDGALEIIDYKSGRKAVTEDQVRAALAMTVYQLLVKRAYPTRPVTATIYALSGGVRASVSLADEELAEVEADLRLLGNEILDTEFEDVRPRYIEGVCGECDFYRRCQPYLDAAED